MHIALFAVALASLVLVAPPAEHDTAAVTPEQALPEPGDALRLAGEGPEVQLRKGVYTAGRGRIETPLPEGYPTPTSPGVIELKTYPVVRRAQVSGEGDTNSGTNKAFWPLFTHIKERDIAMTSPVEIDLVGLEDGEKQPDQWTMSFLYRTADLGPTGQDGKVEVIDAPEVTVVSLGFLGGYSMKNVRKQLDELRDWLATDGLWLMPAGEPRVFHYNGPGRWFAWRWGEVQIPVQVRPTLDLETAPDAGDDALASTGRAAVN